MYTAEDNQRIEAAKAHFRTVACFKADENFEANKAEFIAKLDSNDPETLVAALNAYSRKVEGAERKAVITLSDSIDY